MYIHVFTSVYTHMYLCIIWNSVQRLCPSFLQVRKVSPASRELKEIKETKASLELKVGESVILAGALLMNRGCMKAPELAESGSLVLHV